MFLVACVYSERARSAFDSRGMIDYNFNIFKVLFHTQERKKKINILNQYDYIFIIYSFLRPMNAGGAKIEQSNILVTKARNIAP